MKKILILTVLLGAGAVAFAEETKYVDPNPFADYGPATQSTEENPLAVNWSRTHDAAIAALTTDEALAAIVADAASAEALLRKVRGAYETDPLVMVQVAAVTQWVMLPDPWYRIWPWRGVHGAGRAVWIDALTKTRDGARAIYIRIFCNQQLELCR